MTDLAGNVVREGDADHAYTFVDGRVAKMEVLPAGGG